jgi:outer membrane protein assembly factor BamB
VKKYPVLAIIFLCSLNSCNDQSRQDKPAIQIRSATYLGNNQRNYYGNKAPAKLDTLWRLYLGEGVSPAYGDPGKLWKGAGWTGQPLVVEENDTIYLIQGAFDYNLKKINTENGRLIWEYRFDDILKGTGTIYENRNAVSQEDRFVILQGSRRGFDKKIDSELCPAFRAISYISGRELWRMNVRQTLTYSRDVDGSALVVGDTGYLALENGLFTVFSANPSDLMMRDGIWQPRIYKEIKFYKNTDTLVHGGNIESESSPCLLGGRIYTTAGSGRVYGYSMLKGEVDWIFEIGSDLNGSPTVTSDSCLLIPVEKQYISGKGGVFKLDPSREPEKSVIWYFPVEDSLWFHWEGGIIGSVAVNDNYTGSQDANLAAFVGVDGYLYVVDHKSIEPDKQVAGPNKPDSCPTPRLVFRSRIGGTISTPVFADNKLIVPLDQGLFLYQYDASFNFALLDSIPGIQLDATPVVWNEKIYVASLDGFLYCFGDSDPE